MKNDKFIENIKKLLPGILNDAEFGALKPKAGQHKRVVFEKGGMAISILLPEENSSEKIRITRSQLFTRIEKKFIETMVDQLYGLLPLNNDDLMEFIADKISTRVVAQTLCADYSDSILVTRVLETLETWSSETYEGSGISASIVIDIESSKTSTVSFGEYVENDFAKVLSNGFDSVITLNRSGGVIEYGTPPSSNQSNWRCPYRYIDICKLTGSTKAIAFLLNRNGEILIFRENELIFAKRRAAWIIFNHEKVIKSMAFANKYYLEEIRQSVYASALDVSFARCGGCIGTLSLTKTKEALKSKMINPADYIDDNKSVKSRVLSLVESIFMNMDRRIRLEIIGIDGATLLDSTGKLIVAGAIIEYKSGSDGGGRSAAAKKLSEFGTSLKISADGKITAYHSGEKKFSFG